MMRKVHSLPPRSSQFTGQKDAQTGSYAVRTQRRIILCPVGMMTGDK